MKEKWIQWKPLDILSQKYSMESMLDNATQLKIILSEEDNKKNKIVILFENLPTSYKYTNKILTHALIHNLKQKHEINFYDKWTLFKIENSNYIKWLSKQSATISDSFPFIHFSILGTNCLLDIVASYEPKVEEIYE